MSRLVDEDGPDALLTPLDDGSGPARRLSRQKSAALVQAALLAAMDAPSSPPPRRRHRPHWWMGGALLVVGAAAVATWQLWRRQEPVAPEDTAVIAPSSPMLPRAERVVPEALAPELPVPSVADAAARERSVPPGPEVVAPEVALEPIAPVKPRSSAPSAAPAPEDLLRRANAHRATGQWKAAEALYLRVIRAEPQGMSAYVARVASGALRLEHLGDARGALRQYQEALKGWPGGLLEEEASHGVTEALRALGDRDGEVRALEAFLARHPDSPHAVSARKRLQEVSGR
ncbi:tetratricopeptide repeat protein [Myxococcus fulvus]|uniref:tetratricopeptide repeat protein n=1 Tax=Myxococcus fulvus TaxID=33 RepID=UPI0020C11158|nr:tetratricopeptide repeat protein [Myxococcus fulvus]MCK8498736.1 tetratricopeptide repeat protein [Myxococcus fulvus]